ncbi:uncharacterized protein YcbK (DUF882 family) [Bradyrhizobium sp. USDA 4341]
MDPLVSRRSVLGTLAAAAGRAATVELLPPALRGAGLLALRAGVANAIRSAGLGAIPLGAMLSQFIVSEASAEGLSVPFRVFNPHTEEKYSVDLFNGGEWNERSVMICHWIFRDWRDKQVVQMDRKLYAAAYVLQRYFDSDGYIQINSGFRTERTNELLRKMGYRAAPESFHLKARAMDLVIPKANSSQVANVAQLFRLGGIGHYPTFTHLDSGPVGRMWFG